MFWPTSTRTYTSRSHPCRRHFMESLKTGQSNHLLQCHLGNPIFRAHLHISRIVSYVCRHVTNGPHRGLASGVRAERPGGSFAIYSPILRLPATLPDIHSAGARCLTWPNPGQVQTQGHVGCRSPYQDFLPLESKESLSHTSGSLECGGNRPQDKLNTSGIRRD